MQGDYRNNRLRMRRLAKGFTLKQLAQKTGFKTSYLVQLEKGLRKGTSNTWVKLAQELQLPVGDLFQEEIERPNITRCNGRSEAKG